MSSSLNALSAVTWEDILKPSLGEKVSETGKTWVTRILGKLKRGFKLSLSLSLSLSPFIPRVIFFSENRENIGHQNIG